jgi:hypothetical protein
MESILNLLKPGPNASALILAVATGAADEIGCFGPRGESKTISALLGMGAHATEHKKAGFPLPVPWIGITDTFNSHKEKTLKSLQKPFWQGAWKIYDGGHKAVLDANGEGVILSLFGIEDAGAVDRARLEAACMWAEEVAPTLEGAGVPELAWDIGLTSLRVPTHARVAFWTSNYPEDDHWSWKRVGAVVGRMGVSYHPEDPRIMCIQIPKGDNPYISDRDRSDWARRLKNRPDLAGRLLENKPGTVQLGEQVAQGFNENAHIATRRLYPVRGEQIFIGQDFGLTPASIIGQELRGRVFIYTALPCQRGGIRQHIEYTVEPWLTRNAPWALMRSNVIEGGYDPAGETPEQADIDQSPVLTLEELLPGYWEPGQVSWEGRKGPMLALFNRMVDGEPALQIDPVEGQPLIKALRGSWFYPKDRLGNVSRDLPKKNHPHSDVGDAFCYLIGRCAPGQATPDEYEVANNQDYRQMEYRNDYRVVTNLDRG